MKWQSIETAPRDKAIILWGLLDPIPSEKELFGNLDRPMMTIGYWCQIDDAWSPSTSPWTGPFFAPTHWMPLPKPPA